jgi:hypothetical protein
MFILVSVKPLCSKFAAAVDVEIGGIVSYWRVCSRCICTGSCNQIQEGKMVLLAKRLPKESQEWNPGAQLWLLKQIIVELQTLNPNFVVGKTCTSTIRTSEPSDNEEL